MLAETKKYKASDKYVLRVIAGEAVLVSVGEGVADFCGIVTLNGSAKVLWKALSEPHTEDELVRALCESFSIPEETAHTDVRQSLSMLTERGMVTCE